ncbi:uncharacterized protein LOC132623516 [Lycium barbarum]|uniref:uncharacterized protein LOC132623516 n=1 Tax=Lycium barbarum TaxID=112863 RepID=UPI00293E941F|nr:uncharacterized protein LOC132623516 [Lycium barbarum]XP_060194273.1 uncharacterized protein LOC132623516 [Lycium barbarum]XP_060194274.1 uncharacterized protein LOC132623516 [Lycium barbarum]XP_060194275.1 uncharacterized protein LOC132623516 [Lycium barbarum]
MAKPILNEDVGLLEEGTVQKHTASEAGMTLTIDSHIDIDKSHDIIKHSLPSNHTTSGNETPKVQSASNGVAFEKADSSLQEKISTSIQETVCQVEEETSLISQSESRRNISSSLQQRCISVSADVSFLGVGTGANKKVLLDSDTNYDKSVLESSCLEDVATSMKNASERRNFENGKHALETNKDSSETHPNSMSNATEDKIQDTKLGNEIQSPTSELSASSLINGILADHLTAEKRRDTGVIRSEFFLPSIKPAAQTQKTTSWTVQNNSKSGLKSILQDYLFTAKLDQVPAKNGRASTVLQMPASSKGESSKGASSTIKSKDKESESSSHNNAEQKASMLKEQTNKAWPVFLIKDREDFDAIMPLLEHPSHVVYIRPAAGVSNNLLEHINDFALNYRWLHVLPRLEEHRIPIPRVEEHGIPISRPEEHRIPISMYGLGIILIGSGILVSSLALYKWSKNGYPMEVNGTIGPLVKAIVLYYMEKGNQIPSNQIAPDQIPSEQIAAELFNSPFE